MVVHWVSGWLRIMERLLPFFLLILASSSSARTPRASNRSSSLGVQLQTVHHRQVVIDNGIIRVTFSSPGGDIIGIKYKGIDNVLEILNEDSNRGYWDVVWNKPGEENIFDKLQATDFSVIMQDEDQVEISFSRKWDVSDGKVPLNVDKRYIVRRGSPGIYLYTILERLDGWPDVDMPQIRVVFKLQQKLFHYMAISDDRQRIMPMLEDRVSGLPLAYPEAILLTNPINSDLRGEVLIDAHDVISSRSFDQLSGRNRNVASCCEVVEAQVDDKYQYSCEDKDNKVHGWISFDPPVGFWMITPSNEFRGGGPVKQDLTSHVGPITLNMFTSTHYTGLDLNVQYRHGEPWKKVFGPAFVYLNHVSTDNDTLALWEDAKEQMSIEERRWPYNFAQSEDFPSLEQRGTLGGQLVVRDRYINERLMYASSAYVGLAAPGDVGSWQTEAKGYQFWTRANSNGQFKIENIRAGVYNLYGFVPGIIGDYMLDSNITIEPGSKTKLGVLTFDPPRNGSTLWEIGIPDRTAAEFFVPQAYPTLMNRLYTNIAADKFRQYGLWDRYTDLYPISDLVYTVGVNSYAEDWFFAQVPRVGGNNTYLATTWQIIFDLESVDHTGGYTLQLALASATVSQLEVRLNDPNSDVPLLTTGVIGKDNAIARHGIHELYRLYSVDVPSSKLVDGQNTIYLTQAKCDSPFHGIMYDYIRLEGPGST